MDDWIAQEASLRLTIFLAGLVIIFALEKVAPRVKLPFFQLRQLINLGLSFINTLALRLLFPVVTIGFAQYSTQHAVGVLNHIVLPDWFEALLAFMVLDLAIYWQHRLFHRHQWLWRLHRVHHSDLQLDVSTGVRFHPGEMILSMLFKLLFIAVLGASATAVLLFEIALNVGALFSHANLKLPKTLDNYLRLLIVTPDMHRVHHSITEKETNSNFGFCLAFWDRLFHSYIAKPFSSIENIHIGLSQFRNERDQQLLSLLINPLKATSTSD